MNGLRGRRRAKGGFALYTVLIVVTIGALVCASVVYSSQGQRATADAAARRVQSRALAWSGVQAAMEELRRQRTEMLRGERPELSDEWSLFVERDGRRAVARLVPQGEGQALLVSEAGKLDVNIASAAMLAAVPGLDEELAERIVAARAGRKFGSVEELAGIAGLRSAFAPADSEAWRSSSPDAFVPPEDAAPATPLRELLTVFSFDPNVQAGMGRNAESHLGVRRIGLAGKWSERLGRAIKERFDEGAANVVKTLMDQGTKFEHDSDIIRTLRRFNSPVRDWPEVLDAFCADPGPYRLGRLDLMTARPEALACVPGIDQAAAEQIVLARGKLTADQRLTPVWLVEENILTVGQFEQAIDHVGTRSLQWRVVIEAGFVDADRDEREERPALSDRIALEVVLDVSSERPRVAYLREVTMAGAARALGPLRAAPEEPVERPGAAEALPPPTPPEPSRSVSSGRGEGPLRRPRESDRQPPSSPGEAGGVEGEETVVDERDPRLGRWTPGHR